MATLAQLRGRVRDHAGLDASDPLHTDAVLNTLINASLQELSAVAEWPWNVIDHTWTLVKDTATYTILPTLAGSTGGPDRQAYRVRRVFVRRTTPSKDHYNLRLVSASEVEDHSEDNSGRPELWAVFDDKVVLSPAPDSNYAGAILHADLNQQEFTMATDGQGPRMPEGYQDSIVSRAGYKAAVRAGNKDMAVMLREDAERWLQVLLRHNRQNSAAPRRRVERDWYSGGVVLGPTIHSHDG